MMSLSTDTTSGIGTPAIAPIALDPDQGDALWFLGCLATVKAGTESTAGRVAVIEHLAPRIVGFCHDIVGDHLVRHGLSSATPSWFDKLTMRATQA